MAGLYSTARRPGSADKRISGRKLQDLRRRFFQRNPLCVACEAKGRTTAAQEMDHIIPLHKGGTYDPENLQALCTPCHKIKTRKDLGQTARGADASGMPLDPDHHWNK